MCGTLRQYIMAAGRSGGTSLGNAGWIASDPLRELASVKVLEEHRTRTRSDCSGFSVLRR